MASAKTVAQKLWIKAGKKVAFHNPPNNHEQLLGELPGGVDTSSHYPADILLAYIENRQQLEKHLTALRNRIIDDGALWIAYYKGASSVKTDINRDSIAKYALSNRLKPVAVISINKNWSGLRLKKID